MEETAIQTNVQSEEPRQDNAPTRPGVMVYFELIKVLDNMTYAEKGRLFSGLMKYAAYGIEPNFTGVLAMLWPLVQSKIDRDSEAYAKVIASRRKAGIARWWRKYATEHGIDPGDRQARAQWLKERMENPEEEDFDDEMLV